jgi:hypothetical protein
MKHNPELMDFSIDIIFSFLFGLKQSHNIQPITDLEDILEMIIILKSYLYSP